MFFNGVIFICNEVKERRSAEVYRDINVNFVERVINYRLYTGDCIIDYNNDIVLPIYNICNI